MTTLLTDDQVKIIFVGTIPAFYKSADERRAAEFDAWFAEARREAFAEVIDYIDDMVSVGFMNQKLARDLRLHFGLGPRG